MADRLPCDADLAFSTLQTLARKMADLSRDSEGLPGRYADQVVEVTREVDEWLDVLFMLVRDLILADGPGGSGPALAGAGALRRLRDGWRVACLAGDRAARDHAGEFAVQAIDHLRLLRLTVGMSEWEDLQVEAKGSEVAVAGAHEAEDRVNQDALDGPVVLDGLELKAPQVAEAFGVKRNTPDGWVGKEGKPQPIPNSKPKRWAAAEVFRYLPERSKAAFPKMLKEWFPQVPAVVGLDLKLMSMPEAPILPADKRAKADPTNETPESYLLAMSDYVNGDVDSPGEAAIKHGLDPKELEQRRATDAREDGVTWEQMRASRSEMTLAVAGEGVEETG